MRCAARPKYCRISIYLASIEGYRVRNASSLEIPSKRLRNHFLVNGVSLVTVIRSRQTRGSMKPVRQAWKPHQKRKAWKSLPRTSISWQPRDINQHHHPVDKRHRPIKNRVVSWIVDRWTKKGDCNTLPKLPKQSQLVRMHTRPLRGIWKIDQNKNKKFVSFQYISLAPEGRC
jgi:hypothetical protein